MFLSHVSSLKPNSYQVLDQYNKRKVLVNSDGLSLVSNVCTHQQSLISLKHGTGNRVCPYHNWSFTIKGEPIGSGRTAYYCQNNTPLSTDSVYEWNSLLFDCKVDYDIDTKFNNMTLVETRIDVVKADYRNIMDLFLDVDHIQSVHAGVYDMIGITDTTVHWDYYENGSVQSVEQGASWIAVYPYTMIEWQQGALFITVSVPDGKNTNVCVFKYMDNDHASNWRMNELVWEKAWAQDKAQAELITSFATTNLEPQKLHFREFLDGINKV